MCSHTWRDGGARRYDDDDDVRRLRLVVTPAGKTPSSPYIPGVNGDFETVLQRMMTIFAYDGFLVFLLKKEIAIKCTVDLSKAARVTVRRGKSDAENENNEDKRMRIRYDMDVNN